MACTFQIVFAINLLYLPMSAPKTVVDLSYSLTSTVNVCDGHPSFECHRVSTIGPDSKSNVSALSLGTHTGTHIDAPYHFFPAGAPVSDLDLSQLIAPAVIVDVRHKRAHEKITLSDLSPYIPKLRPGMIVLFLTGWSRFWCKPQYRSHPSLDSDVAHALVANGISVIGIDAMSPDDMPEDGAAVIDVHNIILGGGGIIAENLTNLEAALALRDPIVSLLPIKIEGADGAPVRAVAWSASEDS